MTQSIPATLRATADHLAAHGWIRHAFYEPKIVERVKPFFLTDGEIPKAGDMQTEHVVDYAHAPTCSVGALAQVTGAREVITDLTGSGETLFALRPEVKAHPVVAHFETVGAYLRDYLYTQHADGAHANSVPFWNDQAARTAEEVILTFHAAADFYEAGNNEAVMATRVQERRAAIRAERRQRGARTEAEALAAESLDWQPMNVDKFVQAKEAMVTLATSVTDVKAYLAKMNETLTKMAEQTGLDPALLAGVPTSGEALAAAKRADPADIPAGDTGEADAVDALQSAMAIVNAATSPVPA